MYEICVEKLLRLIIQHLSRIVHEKLISFGICDS